VKCLVAAFSRLLHTHTRTHTGAHTHARTRAHTHTQIRTNTHARAHTYKHKRAHTHTPRYLAQNEDAYLQWVTVLDMLSMFVDALPLMDDEDNLTRPSGLCVSVFVYVCVCVCVCVCLFLC
jgi:hypothetical protein